MSQQTRLTTAALNTLNATTLGNLRPYQLEQVLDYLKRANYDRGAPAGDGTDQPTMTQIVTARNGADV